MTGVNGRVHDVFLQRLDRAKAFVNAPEGAKAGKEVGVLEGEIRFLEEAEGY